MKVESEKLSAGNNVPKLRFGGFEGDWKFEALSSYLFEYKEKANAKTTKIPVYTSSRTGLYPQSSYFDNRELQNESDYGVVPFGYFVYRHMSDDSTFKFNLNKVAPQIAVSKEYPVFTTKHMDSAFLLDYLNHGKQFKVFATMQKQGGTRTRLYFKKLITLKLPIPILEEQQKIASFLSKVDEKIGLLGEKKAKLVEYKKGVMQGLFSGEWKVESGKLTFIPPTLRFKADDGSNFPDWEEKRLGDVNSITGGGTPSTADESLWGGNIQWFTPTELKTKYVTVSKRTITDKGLSNSSAKILPKGTVLFSSRATVGDVSIAQQECTTNQGFQSFNGKPKKANNEFTYYWISSHKDEFLRRASGSTFLEISKSEIAKVSICLPSLDEQLKIANFLSAIDKKIDLTTAELEKVKEWKKGLLQQMFV